MPDIATPASPSASTRLPAPVHTTAVRSTFGGTLVGTGTLTRLGLRRDRWMLSSWVIGFAAMAGISASATVGLYPDVASRVAAADGFNASAALIAMYGRVYDPTSLGALSLIKLTAFGSALIAILMLFVVIRHSRAEEESGRLELLGGGRVGRSAPLVAALVLACGASVVLGLLTALWLTFSGLPVTGSLAFGLGWAASGLAFSAVGGVVAQLTTSARAARGLGLVVLAVAYALRAIGDLAEPGPSWLSWLSPIGWTQQVRAYAGDRWEVLALPVLLCVVLVPTAFALRSRRDLGSGLLADRPGPAHGSMESVWALAVRLHGRSLLGWLAGFAIGGLLLGSIASSVDDFMTNLTAREFFEKLGGSQVLLDTFIGAELGILGAIAAAYGVGSVDRLRSEETEGHAELLLVTTTSRRAWALSHYVVALAGVAVLMTTAGLTMGLGAALSLEDWGQFPRIFAVALAQIPAAWVMTSLVLTLFGGFPRATSSAWGALVLFMALGEFGALWGAPEWLMNLSPLQYTPRLPVEAGWMLPLVGLTVVAALLAAAGLGAWQRRDVPA
jgi:ABC-2 type transport system permease protein